MAKKPAPSCAVPSKRGAPPICVGDRVERTIKLPPARIAKLKKLGYWQGVVTAVEMGADNSGRPKPGARVRFDGDEAGDRPSPWLLSELRKI